MKARPPAPIALYFLNSLLAHSILLSIFLFIPLTDQNAANESLRDFFVYLGKEGETAAASAPASPVASAAPAMRAAPVATSRNPERAEQETAASKGVSALQGASAETAEPQQPATAKTEEQVAEAPAVQDGPELEISGDGFSNDLGADGLIANKIIANETVPAVPAVPEMPLTNGPSVKRPVNPAMPFATSRHGEQIAKNGSIKNSTAPVNYSASQPPVINAAALMNVPNGVSNMAPPLPDSVQSGVINTPGAARPAVVAANRPAQPATQGQGAAPQNKPGTGGHAPFVNNPGNNSGNKTGKDNASRPSGKVPVAGIILPKDIQIEVLSDDTQAPGLMVRMLGRPYPSPDDDDPWAKEHEVAVQRDALPADSGKPGKVFSVAHAGKGVYTFIVKNSSGNVCDADIVFHLHEGALKGRAKEYNGITLQPGQQMEFKFILPDMLFWDDNSRFSGTIEDSDTKTKFVYDSGLVWKEKKSR